MRMMAVFAKGERLRHIGHLDIQRAVQRALRRSGLPVAYSQGFNPHILVSFASALSTGAFGERELMDVTLEKEVSPEAFLQAMNRAMPPQMQLSEARLMDDRHPALTQLVTAAEYDIRVLEPAAAKAMAAAVPDYLAQEHIMAVRKTKSGEKECDCRPLILSLEARDDTLHCVLTLTERESCKPGMLVSSLAAFAGVEEPRVLVDRLRLLGAGEGGALAGVETL